MKPEPNYEVDFYRKAGNLFYKDSQGILYFTFDMDASNGQKLIILDTTPLTEDFKMVRLADLDQIERSRIALASERVKQYLVSCGYQVDILIEP